MNEAQKAVLEIVESVYTDGVDAIGEPELSEDEEFILVPFQDQDFIASNSSISASVKGFLSINPRKIVKIFIAVIRTKNFC
jgi:hypothetical protein